MRRIRRILISLLRASIVIVDFQGLMLLRGPTLIMMSFMNGVDGTDRDPARPVGPQGPGHPMAQHEWERFLDSKS